MFIKRYLVKSMPQAVEMIKVELGPDAVILSSHKVRAQGLAGFFGRTIYEVIAAVDEDKQVGKNSLSDKKVDNDRMASPVTPANVRAQYQANSRTTREVVATIEKPRYEVENKERAHTVVEADQDPSPKIRKWEPERIITKKPELPVEETTTISPPPLQDIAQARAAYSTKDSVANELKELRAMLTHYVIEGPGTEKNEELKHLTSLWTSTGLSSSLVERFVQKLQSYQSGIVDTGMSISEATRAFVHESLATSAPLRLIKPSDRMVALVGPTGVGKTTTIAKLAAHAKLKEGRAVGLLTVDTFRVAAVEQLRTYSDILNIPFAIAESASEIQDAVDQLADCDLVLIDTTGRSFLDTGQINELKQLLTPIPLDLTYLVISLTARPAEAFKVAELLDPIGYQGLLFTKADEAILPSLAITMADQLRLPLSYISAGQHVPSDLFTADNAWFLERFSGGASNA